MFDIVIEKKHTQKQTISLLKGLFVQFIEMCVCLFVKTNRYRNIRLLMLLKWLFVCLAKPIVVEVYSIVFASKPNVIEMYSMLNKTLCYYLHLKC